MRGRAITGEVFDRMTKAAGKVEGDTVGSVLILPTLIARIQNFHGQRRCRHLSGYDQSS